MAFNWKSWATDKSSELTNRTANRNQRSAPGWCGKYPACLSFLGKWLWCPYWSTPGDRKNWRNCWQFSCLFFYSVSESFGNKVKESTWRKLLGFWVCYAFMNVDHCFLVVLAPTFTKTPPWQSRSGARRPPTAWLKGCSSPCNDVILGI